MAKSNIFQCDICGKEVRYTSWHNSPTSVSLSFVIPQSSAQKKFEREKICKSCAATLIAGFDRAYYSIERAGSDPVTAAAMEAK
jgi:RNase P subunit RPR2